jgi:hypothetical protein
MGTKPTAQDARLIRQLCHLRQERKMRMGASVVADRFLTEKTERLLAGGVGAENKRKQLVKTSN